jgi:hypothetical protein
MHEKWWQLGRFQSTWLWLGRLWIFLVEYIVMTQRSLHGKLKQIQLRLSSQPVSATRKQLLQLLKDCEVDATLESRGVQWSIAKELFYTLTLEDTLTTHEAYFGLCSAFGSPTPLSFSAVCALMAKRYIADERWETARSLLSQSILAIQLWCDVRGYSQEDTDTHTRNLKEILSTLPR